MRAPAAASSAAIQPPKEKPISVTPSPIELMAAR